jgi:tetratricopeptide (TPR) repeat protein
MSIDIYLSLQKWAEGLRSDLPLSDAIDIVSARMAKTDHDNEFQDALARILLDFLTASRRYGEAVRILDEIIASDPDEAYPLIQKAELYLHRVENFNEALSCIDLALERASRNGIFLRHALNVKARILLQMRRGEQLSQVLEEIMSLRIKKGVSDIGRERDFVDRAPPGLISEDVVARYNAFRPRRAGDHTANVPPKYEYPDDAE